MESQASDSFEIPIEIDDICEPIIHNERAACSPPPPPPPTLVKEVAVSLNNAIAYGSQSNLCNGTPLRTVNYPPDTLPKVQNAPPADSNVLKKPTIALTHLPRRPPVDIEFVELSYSVSEGRKRGYKTILKCVNGKFRSGELTGIMGPSGAGKSTLMNILAGYKTSNLSGSVLINGKERSLRRFRKMSCYIMQDDCLSPLLTVREAMQVSANLKLGKGINLARKKVIITEILDTLGLIECADTSTYSLSGGQRKRLSIALELVNNPPVMFFDEPTSGLDSSSCFQCISLLTSLARGGRTVICTIHQPSARLFEMFDHLYMLAEGQCIYKGPTISLIPFLHTLGLECPSYHNPADYVMEVASGEHGDYVAKLVMAVKAGRCSNFTQIHEIATNKASAANDIIKGTPSSQPNGYLHNSDTNGHCNHSINSCTGSEASYKLHAPALPSTHTPCGGQSPATCTTSLLEDCAEEKTPTFPTTGFQQFWILLKRTILIILRDTTLTRMRLLAHFIIGILLGIMYYDIGNNAAKVMSNAGCLFFTTMFTMFTAMMPTILTFPMEMSVFIREHLNYWYSLKAYYFAKTLADIPFQIILTACYVMGVYYLTSQPLEATRFAMVLLISVLTALVSQSLGLLVGAAFNIEAGVFLGPISTIPLVLFSGFFANLDDIPVYLRWATYASYVRYSFEGTMIAIYGLDRPKLDCQIMYCHFKYPNQFLEQMAMSNDMRTYIIDVLVLCTIFVVARVFAYFVLRVKLLQNR